MPTGGPPLEQDRAGVLEQQHAQRARAAATSPAAATGSASMRPSRRATQSAATGQLVAARAGCACRPSRRDPSTPACRPRCRAGAAALRRGATASPRPSASPGKPSTPRWRASTRLTLPSRIAARAAEREGGDRRRGRAADARAAPRAPSTSLRKRAAVSRRRPPAPPRADDARGGSSRARSSARARGRAAPRRARRRRETRRGSAGSTAATVATCVCCSMISDSQIRYGSRVSCQGRSWRPCARCHATRRAANGETRQRQSGMRRRVSARRAAAAPCRRPRTADASRPAPRASCAPPRRRPARTGELPMLSSASGTFWLSGIAAISCRCEAIAPRKSFCANCALPTQYCADGASGLFG